PIEADVRGGGVHVAPGALQRLVEEQALPAGREEQRVDGADQEPHAKRLVAAVAQPPVHADGVSARGGLQRLRPLAEHQEPRRAGSMQALASARRICTVVSSAMRRLPPATAPRVVRTLAIARKSASAPSAIPSTGDTMAIGSTARNDWR